MDEHLSCSSKLLSAKQLLELISQNLTDASKKKLSEEVSSLENNWHKLGEEISSKEHEMKKICGEANTILDLVSECNGRLGDLESGLNKINVNHSDDLQNVEHIQKQLSVSIPFSLTPVRFSSHVACCLPKAPRAEYNCLRWPSISRSPVYQSRPICYFEEWVWQPRPSPQSIG